VVLSQEKANSGVRTRDGDPDVQQRSNGRRETGRVTIMTRVSLCVNYTSVDGLTTRLGGNQVSRSERRDGRLRTSSAAAVGGGGDVAKARSLVFDLFGDYLRYRGGEARLRSLVSLMGCFDVPEPTVRVVVARLRKEGWLSSRREGRETVYALTDSAWALLDEGRERIFHRAQGPWDGQWHMVIYSVPESERGLREQLRKKLAWFGFGPLSSSVWLSPHDRVGLVKEAFADEPAARLDAFRSRTSGAAEDRGIAARSWDLHELDRAYVEFLATYRPRLASYRAGELQGADALVERMRLIHDYRRFPFRDPDLPPELLPEGWNGRVAHDVFIEAHGLLRGPAEACVDALTGSAAILNERAG
jgi:phenylacetic acid degradation operon negative regulatory protein